MQDAALLRKEQDDAYDAALIEDVLRESLQEVSSIAVSTSDAGDATSNAPTAINTDIHTNPSPQTLRRLRLQRFEPKPKPSKRVRRRANLQSLIDEKGDYVPPLTRSRRARP